MPSFVIKKQLFDLRMAVIMDEFSLAGFAPGCQTLALTAANWLAEVTHFCPQMLLVESAWWWADKSWHRKVSGRPRILLARCPVVFYAKYISGLILGFILALVLSCETALS